MASRQEIDKELLAAIMQGSGRKAIQPRPMTQLREDIASLGDLMVQGGEAVEEYNEPMVNTNNELERFVGLLPQIFMANALKGPGSVMQLARPGAVEPIVEAIGQGVEQFKADPIGTTKSVVSSGIEAAKDPIGLAGAMQPTDVLGAGAGLGMLGKLGRVVNSKRGPDLFADVTGVDVDRPKQPLFEEGSGMLADRENLQKQFQALPEDRQQAISDYTSESQMNFKNLGQRPDQSMVNEIIDQFAFDIGISPALTQKLKTSELLDSSLTDIKNKQDLDAWLGQIMKNDPDRYEKIQNELRTTDFKDDSSKSILLGRNYDWWTELRALVERNPDQWARLRQRMGGSEVSPENIDVPMTAFHGTARDFEEFNPATLPVKKTSTYTETDDVKRSRTGFSGNATWVSMRPHSLPAYGQNVVSEKNMIGGRQGPRTMPLYVNAKNPLIINKNEGKYYSEKYNNGREPLPIVITDQAREAILKDGYDSVFYFYDDLQRKEFDNLYELPPNIPDEVIVFDSNQLKSKFGNTGGFSRDQNNIIKSAGGVVVGGSAFSGDEE